MAIEEAPLESFEKQPGEKFPYAVSFANRLPAGLTIAGCSVSAKTEPGGVDATATVLEAASPAYLGTDAYARVKAGTDGVTYKLTYSVTLSDSYSVLEEDILMVVKEK